MSKAVIIGGGVIGFIFGLLPEQNQGWEVEILEKGDLLDNCSYGNAGMITPEPPVASAGWRAGAWWSRWHPAGCFNSKSPFYVKPSLDAELFGWGLKFLKSATKRACG